MTWEQVVFVFAKGFIIGFVVSIFLNYNKYTRLIVYGSLIACLPFFFIYSSELMTTPTVFSNLEISISYILGMFIGTGVGRSSAEEIKKDWQRHSSEQTKTGDEK